VCELDSLLVACEAKLSPGAVLIHEIPFCNIPKTSPKRGGQREMGWAGVNGAA